MKKIKKTLFGYKPNEVVSEITRLEQDYQGKIAAITMEIERAAEELRKSEEKRAELETRLENYIAREHQIAEVMLTAQVNSQKIEEQAREKAHTMLEHSEEELKRKNRELDFLRRKVARFKEEFRETLDKYKFSLDSVNESEDEVAFAPTLVVNDKPSVKAIAKDVSS